MACEDNSVEGKVSDAAVAPSEDATVGDQLKCKICLSDELSIVFLPCKHFASCSTCGRAVKKCVICREHIRGVLRVFLS